MLDKHIFPEADICLNIKLVHLFSYCAGGIGSTRGGLSTSSCAPPMGRRRGERGGSCFDGTQLDKKLQECNLKSPLMSAGSNLCRNTRGGSLSPSRRSKAPGTEGNLTWHGFYGLMRGMQRVRGGCLVFKGHFCPIWASVAVDHVLLTVLGLHQGPRLGMNINELLKAPLVRFPIEAGNQPHFGGVVQELWALNEVTLWNWTGMGKDKTHCSSILKYIHWSDSYSNPSQLKSDVVLVPYGMSLLWAVVVLLVLRLWFSIHAAQLQAHHRLLRVQIITVNVLLHVVCLNHINYSSAVILGLSKCWRKSRVCGSLALR